ncbi:MAG: hypothetical protein ABIG30_01280 [Candidatus Aenigmatarchaeota archaeon]
MTGEILMDLTPAEGKVLRIIAEMNLARQFDIQRALLNNGFNTQEDDIETIISNATNELMHKKLVTKIHPIGFACFIITKQGTSLLNTIKK